MSHSDMVIILPKEVFSRFGPSCFKVKRQIYHKLSQIKHLWLVNPEPRSQIVLYEHLTIWPYFTNSTELESLRPMVNHVPLFFSSAMCQYASGALLPPGDAEKRSRQRCGARRRERWRRLWRGSGPGPTPLWPKEVQLRASWGRWDGFEMFESWLNIIDTVVMIFNNLI